MPTSPRRARVPRRFSSSSVGATWTRKFSQISSTSIPRGRRQRRTSSVGRYTPHPFSDNSEIDEHGGSESDISHGEPFSMDLEPRPLIYASLPPSPIASPTISPVLVPPFPESTLPNCEHPFSLWDYLREELLATDFDSHQELKWERVSNFLSIPLAMEKIIGFGFILCFDSFLYTFTILPIRFTLAASRIIVNMFSSPASLPPSQKADILRTFLLILSILILIPLTDASKIYHFIRGQDTIKLYVIFNALEIADRLCASIGQDILDCLFSRSTLEYLSYRVPVTHHTLRPFAFFGLATLYTVIHTLVMVYQLISLNVAVNSYDHALLTLLVSNQFVEIKGSVFKKFEKDNLFQITCADIVERFTLALMLFVVAFRNLIELSGSEFDLSEGFVLPKSFGWFRGNNVLWTISYPVLTVMISEMLVDWLKHAFITKFNHIRPSVYERFTDVLCRDLASGSAVGRRGARKHTYVDQSPLVARRLGFASLPLAVLAVLVGSQSLSLAFSAYSDASSPWTVWTVSSLTGAEIVHYLKWATMGVLFWLCFVVVKVIMGVNLISYATRRRTGMEAREAEDDAVNGVFGQREPIGEGKEEQAYNLELRTLLDNRRDDVGPTAEIGERGRMESGESAQSENRSGPVTVGREDARGGRRMRRRVDLNNLTRFTMVKRIW